MSLVWSSTGPAYIWRVFKLWQWLLPFLQVIQALYVLLPLQNNKTKLNPVILMCVIIPVHLQDVVGQVSSGHFTRSSLRILFIILLWRGGIDYFILYCSYCQSQYNSVLFSIFQRFLYILIFFSLTDVILAIGIKTNQQINKKKIEGSVVFTIIIMLLSFQEFHFDFYTLQKNFRYEAI